jgi:hypothetical protein
LLTLVIPVSHASGKPIPAPTSAAAAASLSREEGAAAAADRKEAKSKDRGANGWAEALLVHGAVREAAAALARMWRCDLVLRMLV